MNFLSKIVLFFFITFLITPTIISVVNQDVDISSFYNLSEEEEKNGSSISFEEIKLIAKTDSYFLFYYSRIKLGVFNLQDDLIICNYKASIFIPPPDLI